jgi:hypothetical protein
MPEAVEDKKTRTLDQRQFEEPEFYRRIYRIMNCGDPRKRRALRWMVTRLNEALEKL